VVYFKKNNGKQNCCSSKYDYKSLGAKLSCNGVSGTPFPFPGWQYHTATFIQRCRHLVTNTCTSDKNIAVTTYGNNLLPPWQQNQWYLGAFLLQLVYITDFNNSALFMKTVVFIFRS